MASFVDLDEEGGERTKSPCGGARESPSWFKSSFSGPSNCCVEVSVGAMEVFVRDSKYVPTPAIGIGDQPMISVPNIDWKIFLSEVVGDVPFGTNASLNVVFESTDSVLFEAKDGSSTLRFNSKEWAAFAAGVTMNEFTVEI